jgi:hypothetical protein
MTTVRATRHHRPSAQAITAKVEACTPAISSGEALQRSHYLVRRIFTVLADFGLRETLPSDWAVPLADGVHFGLLSHGEADRLIQTLEDFLREGRPERPAPGPDQLSLFGCDEP